MNFHSTNSFLPSPRDQANRRKNCGSRQQPTNGVKVQLDSIGRWASRKRQVQTREVGCCGGKKCCRPAKAEKLVRILCRPPRLLRGLVHLQSAIPNGAAEAFAFVSPAEQEILGQAHPARTHGRPRVPLRAIARGQFSDRFERVLELVKELAQCPASVRTINHPRGVRVVPVSTQTSCEQQRIEKLRYEESAALPSLTSSLTDKRQERDDLSWASIASPLKYCSHGPRKDLHGRLKVWIVPAPVAIYTIEVVQRSRECDPLDVSAAYRRLERLLDGCKMIVHLVYL